MAEVRCSVCGVKFKQGDHVYDKIKEDLPWKTLAEKLRDESLDLASSMFIYGADSMGTYHKMLVLSQTLQAIDLEMRRTASQKPVKP
jgi:hypothetical protein